MNHEIDPEAPPILSCGNHDFFVINGTSHSFRRRRRRFLSPASRKRIAAFMRMSAILAGAVVGLAIGIALACAITGDTPHEFISRLGFGMTSP